MPPSLTTTLQTDHDRYLCAEEGGGVEGAVVDGRPAGLATGTRETAGRLGNLHRRPRRRGVLPRLERRRPRGPARGARRTGARKPKARLGIFVFNRPSGGAWEALIPHEMPYDRVAFEIACRPGHFLCRRARRPHRHPPARMGGPALRPARRLRELHEHLRLLPAAARRRSPVPADPGRATPGPRHPRRRHPAGRDRRPQLHRLSLLRGVFAPTPATRPAPPRNSSPSRRPTPPFASSIPSAGTAIGAGAK